MRIIRTTDPTPKDTLGQLALYNAMDVLTLPEIFPQLQQEFTEFKQQTYAFEMQLQAALLEMQFNGVPVDIGKRAELIRSFTQRRVKTEAMLHKFCLALDYYRFYKSIAAFRYSNATGISAADLPNSWDEWLATPLGIRREWKKLDPEATADFQKSLKAYDKPFNANSPTQKLQLFYHFFGTPNNIISQVEYSDYPAPWLKTHGIPEYKARKVGGEFGPSTNRDSLEKIQKRALDSDERDAAYWAQPFISCCLAISDYTKSLGFLNSKLDQGWFRSSFGAVTETGRLASKDSHDGFGSNAQNITPELRIILTCPLETKIGACDYEQIESRNVAAICYELFGATAYLIATESGDLHSLACSMVWDDLPWPTDFSLKWLALHGPFPRDLVKAAKKIANQKFYRQFSRRDLSKRLGHGSNYLGKPEHMAKQTHIPVNLVRHYQDVYFEAFPEIPLWHQWTIEQVMTKQELTTILFNRTRQFFNRPTDDATIREAVAYVPQSMAADYTNKALLELHKAAVHGDLPVTIFLQKHDELGFRYAEKDESLVIPRVCDIMEQSFVLTDPEGNKREWSVPVEALVGWNLGFKSDKNPDGLTDFPDTRTRSRNPFDLGSFSL